jgi:hypothetical protein
MADCSAQLMVENHPLVKHAVVKMRVNNRLKDKLNMMGSQFFLKKPLQKVSEGWDNEA